MPPRQKLYTNWDDVPIVMDLPIAAQIVGKSIEWVKQQCQQGKFPAYKEGNEWRVEKGALQQHIKDGCVKKVS